MGAREGLCKRLSVCCRRALVLWFARAKSQLKFSLLKTQSTYIECLSLARVLSPIVPLAHWCSIGKSSRKQFANFRRPYAPAHNQHIGQRQMEPKIMMVQSELGLAWWSNSDQVSFHGKFIYIYIYLKNGWIRLQDCLGPNSRHQIDSHHNSSNNPFWKLLRPHKCLF